MDRVDIGRRLREARRSSNVRVADVARAAGVTPQALYLWERGERNAAIEDLERVAEAVGYRVRVHLERADSDLVDVAVPPDVAPAIARMAGLDRGDRTAIAAAVAALADMPRRRRIALARAFRAMVGAATPSSDAPVETGGVESPAPPART